MGSPAGQRGDGGRCKFYQGLTEAFEAFASAQFELDAVQADGLTLREHYQGLAERTDRTVAEIANLPPMPEGCELLWRAFMALHSSRNMAGMGPARISWADIDAYQRVHRFRFEAWELDAIRRADTAFLIEAGKRKPKG